MVCIRMWTPALSYWLLAAVTSCAAVFIEEGVDKYVFARERFSLTCNGKGTLSWKIPDGFESSPFTTSQNKSILHVNATTSNGGTFTCTDAGDTNSTAGIHVHVYDFKGGFIKYLEEESHTFYVGKEAWLDCRASGIPEHEIHWFKNRNRLNVLENNSSLRFQNRKQTLIIEQCQVQDSGTYECIIINSAVKSVRSFNITVIQMEYLPFLIPKENVYQPKSTFKPAIATVSIVFIFLLIFVVYIIWRIKTKKSEQILTEHDMKTFHDGSLLPVDPDMGIDEQAVHLPYIKDYEFPREKLKFGKQLGSGAFGVVMKAEAEGLKSEENFTTVAVKMAKPHSDVMHLRALMTELKILTYVGHHLNVLNLLGACTTNLIHMELFIMLEYCRYGNLLSYLQKHRESFINQINPVTDLIDFSIGKDAIPEQSTEEIFQNPFGGTSKDSQLTSDNSSVQLQCLDVAGEEPPSAATSSSGSSNPADERWTITYKADYKEKLANPLNTKDLLCWSYQVATGMEYLSSRKVVHADLAARNILLADNNIIKICDFGLARKIYNDMDYTKKGRDPLPVKWMPIESIEDRIFSTKSDVWSYGVLLWEIFTLGRSPYPGMLVNEEFIQQLIRGYRMTKPPYSTNHMYRVMLECWKAEPIDRPSFTDLKHLIGDALDNQVKQHYVELNTPYVNQNTRIMSTGNNNINFSDGDNSDYIQPEFPERLCVNMKPVGSEACSKIDKISEEESENLGFEEESVYLPMTK